MSELVPDDAIEIAAMALRSPSHRAGPPDPDLVEIWKRTARITLEAAAPLIVSAWAESVGREFWRDSHISKVLRARASVLRGEGDR